MIRPSAFDQTRWPSSSRTTVRKASSIRRQSGTTVARLDDRAAAIAIQKLAFSIAEAATSAALSRSLLYDLIREGELKSFRVRGRRRRLIYVDDLRAWLLSQRAAASETDPVCRNPDAAQDGAAPTGSFGEKQ